MPDHIKSFRTKLFKTENRKKLMMKLSQTILLLLFIFSVNAIKAQKSDESHDPMDTKQTGKVAKLNSNVESMPRFPGCEYIDDKEERKKCSDKELLQFIYGNLMYPGLAKKNRTQGMVMISFTVDADGEITEASIIRDIGDGCGEEALRVINEMPLWIPGIVRGESTAVQMRIPVRFRL